MSSTSHPSAANKGSMRAAFVFCSPMFSLRFCIFCILFLSLGNTLVKLWCAELVISIFSPWILYGVLPTFPSLNDDILTQQDGAGENYRDHLTHLSRALAITKQHS